MSQTAKNKSTAPRQIKAPPGAPAPTRSLRRKTIITPPHAACALSEGRTTTKSAHPTRTLPGGRTTTAALATGPNGLPLCRWCDLEILAKRWRTFCSDYCVHQWRLRTDPGYIRDQVLDRDCGICAVCRIDTIAAFNALKRARGAARAAGLRLYGMKSITARRTLWDADHIRPAAEGGGQCDLDNLRTLCLLCHREATSQLRLRLTTRRLTTA